MSSHDRKLGSDGIGGDSATNQGTFTQGDGLISHVELLQATLDSTLDGILTTNTERIPTFWNQRFLELWKIPSELSSDNVFQLLASRAKEPEAFLAEVDSAYTSPVEQTRRDVELVDGRTFEVFSHVQCLGQGYEGRVWTFRDSTGRSESEVARALLASVVESSDDAIITKTLRGIITSWNRGAERIFGYTADEIVGKSVLMLIPPERQSEEPEILARLTEGKRIDHYETVRVHKDGSRLAISLTVSPVRDAMGRIVGVSKIARDVTVQRQLEVAQQELLDSEREARREAEKLGRIKDEFLATLSHELRTPLNAIIGWSHILRKYASDPVTISEGIDVIERNAKLQTQLVDDLLDMSRIVSGKMRLDLQEVDLAQVIEAALNAVRPNAEAKGLLLQFDPEPFAGSVHGDAARLQQVVWNLLTNAIKFTPNNGKIVVSLSRIEANAVISVTDSGRGIRPEFLPHLFERFSQQDSSAAREHGGLGIGLALVKQMVDLHSGSVHAASPGENAGSTFSVHLPIAVKSLDQMDAHAGGTDAQRNTNLSDLPDLSGLVILVVDDEPDARYLLKRILQDVGARVIVTSSVDEAFRELGEDVDVLICDIGMPGKDGYLFIKEVRGQGNGIPAIALTAFARPLDRSKAMAAGFHSHVGKPLDPVELILNVGSLTGRIKSRA